MYRHFPEPPKSKYRNDGLLDVQLAVSRDGVLWTRPDRQPYVGLGTPRRRASAHIYMAVRILRLGDELYQYYGGYDWSHTDTARPYDISNTAGIFLVVQRLDGFISADAAYNGGSLTTPPITFTGKHLVLNIDCSALGTARVEILNSDGLPIPGYTAADCEEIFGNHVNLAARFAGGDLSALAGKPVRLRFIMRAAKLYAFQFTEQAPPIHPTALR